MRIVAGKLLSGAHPVSLITHTIYTTISLKNQYISDKWYKFLDIAKLLGELFLVVNFK